MIRFKQFLKEGGAFGHLSNVFDINFNFGEMKEVIVKSLKGKLENARIKTDGQNLMFSVINGQVRTARNRGHIKNFGQNSMTSDQLAAKFKGRGGLEIAYNNAAKDIQDAVNALSDKQIDKIFKNGHKFMSMEVIHTASPNMVWYGSNQLRFHGTREYDEAGNQIGDFKEDGDTFAGMVKQREKHNQGTFALRGLEIAKLPEVPDFKGQQKSFVSELEKIMTKFKLKNSDRLNDYKVQYFNKIFKKQGIKNDQLIQRWVFGDKSYTINDIKKDNYTPKQLTWILDFEKKKLKDEWKKMILPFEFLFLRLGATILKNMQSFMVVNPNKSVQRINQEIDKALKVVEKSKNPKFIKKVALELRRIEAAGGRKLISPEEGITFMFKGQFLKLTGLFAPTNQITGILFQIAE